MSINLVTSCDSSVLEIIGNLHESKTIYAGETHLILAKLRIARVTKATSHIRESSTSDELIADLESHLGDIVTSYLSVRLTYKHSGFLHYKRTAINWEGGMSSHTTRLQTEASAVIKRRNLQSAWSPRTSREVNSPLEVNPLIKLIEMHLPINQAHEAIRRLGDERIQIPMARRLRNGSEVAGGSSEETVKASAGSGFAARIESTLSMSIIHPQPGPTTLKDSKTMSDKSIAQLENQDTHPTPQSDPARKIWTEMRRHSRGHRDHRCSVSATHHSTDSDDCSPSRLGSSVTVDDERKRIQETALRNKRSVGADTLRSIAPSLGKAKGSTIGGFGLGAGRTWWGWGW